MRKLKWFVPLLALPIIVIVAIIINLAHKPVEKLMGINHYGWWTMNENLFELVKSHGGNVWREYIIFDVWKENHPYWEDPSITFRSRMLEMMQWANARNIKVIIGAVGMDYVYSDDPSWNQFSTDIILNKDGMGDRWINSFGEIIQSLQPYAIDIINEPRGIKGTSYENSMTIEEFVDAYKHFCVRAIRAWRTFKPDLVAIVGGAPPIWDMGELAKNPIDEPNIIYAIHHYYASDGTLGIYPIDADYAYWDGRLVEARQLLEDYLLHALGIEALLNARLPILMEEIGTSMNAPNWDVFLNDIYAFCKRYNIGTLYHALTSYPETSGGMLNQDLTLNQLGELWALLIS